MDRHVAALYENGMTAEQVGRAVGWSTNRVFAALRRLGVARRPKGPAPTIGTARRRSAEEQRARREGERAALVSEVVRLREAGESFGSIGQMHGKSRQWAHQIYHAAT